jgi:hypothetical protein
MRNEPTGNSRHFGGGPLSYARFADRLWDRGLMALDVVLIAAVAVFATVGIPIRLRMKNDPSSIWRIVSTLVLMLPLILWPLG